MRFANPNFLLLVFAVPLYIFLLYWRERYREILRKKYATARVQPKLINTPNRWRRRLASALYLLGILLAVIAGARPQWGYEDRRLQSAGTDLIIAVDTSKSMLAEDYKPNRLARAKELLQNIIWSLKGDRVGIIAFAGDAAVVCPLTADYAMARTTLEGLDVNTVSQPGTDIGRAIDVALGAFELAAQGDKVLVLLTDGEDHGGRAREMAEQAAGLGVRIYCIGIGTTQGMPIPEDGSYKTDRSGRLVSTKLDFATLTQIAEITKGTVVKANPSGVSEIQPIIGEIERMQRSQQQETVVRVYTERFPWFLAVALCLLGLEMFVFESRRRHEVRAS
ncbi:MAG: VWA domain-containing protein [Candidatus Sumerlaeaceae bacterium]|nr:VWA domain-containing protein [Candidatus Sumerlaeaceae bacterium]